MVRYSSPIPGTPANTPVSIIVPKNLLAASLRCVLSFSIGSMPRKFRVRYDTICMGYIWNWNGIRHSPFFMILGRL